jgi:hypothetical protein
MLPAIWIAAMIATSLTSEGLTSCNSDATARTCWAVVLTPAP